MSTSITILQGNVGVDAELKGTATTFSIATDEKYKDKQGNDVEKTEWHRCVCFGGLGEWALKHIKKGAKVVVTGQNQTDKYEKKEFPGAVFYSTSVKVRNIDMIVWAKNDEAEADPDLEVSNDDIPF